MAIVTVSTSNTFNEWRVVTNQLVTEVNKTESGTAALSVDTLTANTVTANGDIAVNGGDLTTTSATFNVANSTATTVNVGGAATTLNLGASSGTTTIRNDASVSGNTSITGTLGVTGNVTLSGELRGPSTFTIDPAVVGDDTGTVVIKGNLQVDGTTTTINSTTLTVDDLNIVLASGAANAAAANGAGITIDGASATITYLSSGDKFKVNKALELDSTLTVAANTNIDSGTFFVDSVNNRVGVGTTTPEATFMTSGDGPVFERVTASTTSERVTATFRAKSTGSSADGFGPYALFQLVDDSATTNDLGGLSIVRSGADNTGKLRLLTAIAGSVTSKLEISSTELVINENSMDLDFRVESDTNTHAFFVDAGNSRVGVNNSSPVAVLDVTSPSDGSPVLGTTKTRVYEFSGTILENSNHQIFKVTIGDIRINALLRIRLMSTNTAGIGRYLGSTMDVVVGKVDGNAYFYVKNQDSGNISLSLPIASGNDVIFGATNSNNGTGQNIGYSCVVELVSSDALSNFTFTDIAPGTTHTGDNSLNTYRKYVVDTSILEATTSNVVFNEGGADVDFRVESDNSTHMLFVDAGEDVVKIGSTTAKGTGNRLIVGPGNTSANTVLIINTEDQNYNGLSISNWDGATTTYGPRIAFDNSGHGGFTIGMGDARNSFDLCSTWGTPLLRLTPSAAIFNEDGADVDFRVESDNYSYMLFVDAGNDVVSIGTSSVLNWYQRALQGPSWAITELLGVDQTGFSTGCYQDAYGFESNWKFAGAYPATLYTQSGDHNFWATSSTRTANGAIVWKQNLTVSDTVVVVNEGSNDVDFRVESDNNTAMLFVDASTDRVGIAESTPLSVVDIVVGDRAAGDNGAMFTLKSGTGNAVNKLNMGTSSTNDYAWIQSVRPSSDNKPLLLNPSGGNVLVGTTSSLAKLTVAGNVFPSADNTYDLGSASYSWANVYTGDLHLSNMKKETGNEIDGTKGDWTIQEGENDLFILNNRTGKKYKFKLEEIQ